MLKKLKNSQNERGLTYAEIIICILVVAMVVGPLCVSFVASTKVRVTSEALNDTILNTETLLEDVKAQITRDIILKQESDSNKVKIVTGSIEEARINSYLTGVPPGATTMLELKNFFGSGSIPVAEADLKDRYHTDRYAYEMAIWPIESAPIDSATGELVFNDANLVTAFKIYSSLDVGYMFDGYSGLSTTGKFLEFKVDPTTFLKAFKDSTERFIPGLLPGAESYAILDVNTITLKPNALASNKIDSPIVSKNEATGNSIKVEKKDIKVGTDIKGYLYQITQNGTLTPALAPTPSMSIIKLDLNGILRDATFKNIATFDGFTFKFENTTAYNQIIKVIRSAIPTTAFDPEKPTLKEIDEKFHIVVEDTGTGKTTIEYVEDWGTYENFVIAIVVRDKNPALGEKGKIIKKMVEIYSYDVTKR